MTNSCIDTIYLNFYDKYDDTPVLGKLKYDMIDLFPKTKIILDSLGLSEKFYLRNNSIASKLVINYKDVFFSFKSVPPRAGEKTILENKICSLQLKSTWFLRNGYCKFLQLFNTEGIEFSISKIEIAHDIPENFIQETMNIFLNHRDKISKFDGKTNIFLNLEYEKPLSITYFNSSTVFKIYDKAHELTLHKEKSDLYYLKNEELLNKPINRIEIGYSTSKRIHQLFNLREKFKNKFKEHEVIKLIQSEFFKNFRINKSSVIKNNINKIINEIKS